MFYSFILFSLFILFYFIEIKTAFCCKNKNLTVFFILISVILLCGLQSIIQHHFNDYVNYSNFFRKVEPINQVWQSRGYNFENPDISFEIGYKYLNSFFKYFTYNECIFFYIINVILMLMVCRFIKKYSTNFFLVFIVYYAFMYPSFQLGILRQGIANGLFLYIIHFLFEKKYLFYIVSIFIISTFHTTALLLIFLPIFTNRKINMNYILFFFLFGNFLYLLKIDIVSFVLKLFLLLNNFPIANSILYYLDANLENNYLGIGYWDRLVQFIIIYFIYSSLSKREKLDSITISFINLSLCLIFLQLYAFNYPIFTNRLRFYFCLFMFIVIDRYLSTSRHKNSFLIGYSLLYSIMMLTISTSYLRE